MEEDVVDDDKDFDSSSLGTKDFWDNTYDRELKTFQEIGDVGEIWFGESCQGRVIHWVEKQSHIPKDVPILDLGCGNGVQLMEMRKRGYSCLTGADYSYGAIELANQIAASENITDIRFVIVDLLSEGSLTGSCLSTKYGLCLDKGTYDAISLMPDKSLESRQKYIQIVWELLRDDGRLVLTSCNWTKEQLLSQFSNHFVLDAEIPTPKFQFGGQTGSTVTSLVFRKQPDH